MKRILISVMMILTVLGAAPRSRAAMPDVDLSAGVGYVGGVNQYEIGGIVTDGVHSEAYPFPISRLEFPIDAGFFTLESGVNLTGKWRLAGSVKRNFTDPSADMKDSDWIFGGFGGNDTKDVYSVSKMDLEAWIADVHTRYTLLEAVHGQDSLSGPDPDTRYGLYAGLGFMYQDYSYDVYNVDQFYPQWPGLPHDVYAGTAILYDLTFSIPYALLGAEMKVRDSWSLELEGRVGWFVHATDKDQHVLRDKVCKVDSDWDGTSYMGRLKARYNITNHWFCAVEGEILYLRVEAPSHTEMPGVSPYTIDEEIQSDQSSAFLTMGYGF